MMKPGIVRQYILQADDISKDSNNICVYHRYLTLYHNFRINLGFSIFAIKTTKGLLTSIIFWTSLESIISITINHRLGILSADIKDEKAEQLIDLVRKIFTLSYPFEVQPAYWKISQTKAKLLKAKKNQLHGGVADSNACPWFSKTFECQRWLLDISFGVYN